MPTGTSHVVTGTLRAAPRGWVLDVADGGEWLLDLGVLASMRAMFLRDRLVTVTGMRDGYDVLAVGTMHRV